MPHFRTWDDTYFDYQGVADLGSMNIGVGELQTDVVRRKANYQFDSQEVSFNS